MQSSSGAAAITVVRLEPGDQAGWRRLYDGYAEFYRVPMTDEKAATVWSWLLDPNHAVKGFLAKINGNAVGLAHIREMPRPLHGKYGGFLDDLFVAPEARGSGAAHALFDAMKDLARERGWDSIRWITAENNYRARAVYDRVAAKTQWLTYEIKL
jgi:GNAT superfamily N-acetyltransferase